MTIDTEKLRALLAAGTPGPWGWNLGALETMTDAGKGFPLNFYPDSVTVAESGTCYECRARPNDINISDADAALIAAAVNALPELLDALDFERRENAEHERNAEKVWAACPNCMGVKEALDGEGGDGSLADRMRVLRNALATAEAERLTLARAYAFPEQLTEVEQQEAHEMSERIVAEADAAAVGKETT